MRKPFIKLLLILLFVTQHSAPQPAYAKSVAIDAIHQAFPASQHNNAVRVAKCESSLNPKAINRKNKNGTVDYGLFQLNSGGTMQSVGVTAHSAMNPYVNAKAAARLWKQRGWGPWVCARKLGIISKKA